MVGGRGSRAGREHRAARWPWARRPGPQHGPAVPGGGFRAGGWGRGGGGAKLGTALRGGRPCRRRRPDLGRPRCLLGARGAAAGRHRGPDRRVCPLVSLAIENTESREELAASRVRIVKAADEARRRIERDLHDGAQQRLLATAMTLTVLQMQLAEQADGAPALLQSARQELDRGLAELRDLARGLHPTVLTDRGLETAVRSLIQRAPVPVDLRAALPERMDATIEAAAYFVVSEALTNVARYAQADAVTIELQPTGGSLIVTIADDGVGGADDGHGSGLRGLFDRVHAVGGRLEVTSPPGGGTRLRAELPADVLAPLGHS